jgi:hypothetical protein
VLLRLLLLIGFSYQINKKKLSFIEGFITKDDEFVLTFTSREIELKPARRGPLL